MKAPETLSIREQQQLHGSHILFIVSCQAESLHSRGKSDGGGNGATFVAQPPGGNAGVLRETVFQAENPNRHISGAFMGGQVDMRYVDERDGVPFIL